MASKLPLLLLLIAITCLSQFYRVSNSVIAPELTRDLGLSARQLGWAGSAFFFALFAVQVPVGMWFDRYGARRTVAALSVLAMLGSLWIADRRRRRRPDRRPRRGRRGLRRLLHVGGVPVLALVRAGQARDGDVLGVRRLQHRHPCRRHAARLDRGDRGLAQRLPRPRRRHRAGGGGLLRRRARPAARPAGAADQTRKLRRDRQGIAGSVDHARTGAGARHALLRLRHHAHGAGRLGRPLSLRRVQARRRAARQRAAGDGRGADRGHPGLRTDGPPAALAQEGRAGRCRDLGGAAGHSRPVAASRRLRSPSCCSPPSASSAPSAR